MQNRYLLIVALFSFSLIHKSNAFTEASGNGLKISTHNLQFNHKPTGHDLRIETTNAWYIKTNAPWVGFSRLNGIGNGKVNIKVNTNNSVSLRKAYVVIHADGRQDTLQVVQDGQPITLVASPSKMEINAQSQQVEVQVVANTNWEVTDHNDWIHIEQIENKLLGKIVFSVEATKSATRTGKVSITAGEQKFDILINQLGMITNTESESVLASLQIYPNPASDYINVEGKVQNIQLTDLSGKQVLSKKVEPTKGSHSIIINHLPKGIYLMYLTTPLGIGVKKVMLR